MDREKELGEMQKWLAKQALEPIKALVTSGAVDHRMAISLVVDAVGQFSDEDYTKEYLRFKANSSEIFKDEVKFEAGYSTPSITGYIYRESSKVDQHFLFKLFKNLNGREYETSEELKRSMEEILQDKRLLEIGCGPGFGLKIFQDLGAKVVGVELRDEYKGGIPGLDIRYGDAVNLDDLCDEKFDIIYTSDFFANACIERREANIVARGMYDRTNEGGVGLHLVTYEKMHPMMYEFGGWLNVYENGDDVERWQKWYDGLEEGKKEDMLWTNNISLDPQYLLRAGFKVRGYEVENGDLIIATER